MSNNYTPDQPVTIIDAKGVRGPGRISEDGRFLYVLFAHTIASEDRPERDKHWTYPLGLLSECGLQILPEPFTEPKGEELAQRTLASFPLLGAAVDTLAGHSSKGDTVKPLTAELRAARAEALALTLKHGAANGTPYEQGVNDHGARWVGQLDRLVKAASLAGEVPAGIAADREWISGARYGWNCAEAGDRAKLDEAIESRKREISAALSSAPDAVSTTVPATAGVCAYDLDERTVTLALDSEDEVHALIATLPAKSRTGG